MSTRTLSQASISKPGKADRAAVTVKQFFSALPRKQTISLALCTLIPLLLLFLPATAFGIPGLTMIQQRLIALFVMAALCWILEPIPIHATSVLVIVLQLMLLSDKGPIWLRSGYPEQQFGELLSYSAILSNFAAPIILLFLGGFFLAMAATKYRLDVNLARVLLKPFGHQPRWVMLGLMLITAVFSMFMSNTATTAMMLSILAPVMALFAPADKGRVAFALSIPLAANIGGMGTPIGTPPNAIAMGYLSQYQQISFGEWMLFAVPLVAVLLLIGWLLLSRLFPAEQERIELTIRSRFLKTPKAIVVYVTFATTILLWLTGKWHGMNSYVVAMIPVALFSVTGIITKHDLGKISWDVLWLVAGGLALGMALDQTGLAGNAVNAIPFAGMPGMILLVAAAVLAVLMANFMSNTATANLLLPLVAALGVTLSSLASLGGVTALILVVALSASLGMALPISTPPNALAHAAGYTTTGQMARVGVTMGLAGLGFILGLVLLLNQLGFFA